MEAEKLRFIRSTLRQRAGQKEPLSRCPSKSFADRSRCIRTAGEEMERERPPETCYPDATCFSPQVPRWLKWVPLESRFHEAELGVELGTDSETFLCMPGYCTSKNVKSGGRL